MAQFDIHPGHGQDARSRGVGILVSVVSNLLSVFTITSHRSHTHSVIHRTEANDQWAYYQGKKIRENNSEIAQSLPAALNADAAKAAPTLQKFSAARDKYASDALEIRADAEAQDAESEAEERRALYYDVAEGLLELGLVLCSLFFLARHSFFPVIGIVAAVAGSAVGVLGTLL